MTDDRDDEDVLALNMAIFIFVIGLIDGALLLIGHFYS